jgi:hypothetical protein
MEREIGWQPGSTGVVASGAGEYVEMEADGVFQGDKGPIVKEPGRHREVAQRRGPELVSIRMITSNLI